jgi:hypothetical protein
MDDIAGLYSPIPKSQEFAGILSNTLAIKGSFLYPIAYRQAGVMVYKSTEIKSWFLPVTVRKSLRLVKVLFH